MGSRNRIFRDRRAISPVLSSLLLTVVAVGAMAIATTATYVITTNLRDQMSERVIVEDTWFNSPNRINIYLRNVGKVAVQISAVYVNHNGSIGRFTKPFNLEIGENRWLNISLDRNWVSGASYYVDMTTTRGTHIADYYKAP
jgi:hypothetical protein